MLYFIIYCELVWALTLVLIHSDMKGWNCNVKRKHGSWFSGNT